MISIVFMITIWLYKAYMNLVCVPMQYSVHMVIFEHEEMYVSEQIPFLRKMPH